MEEPIIHTRCIKCNRPLKTPLARKRGYGTHCWQQYLKENKRNTKCFIDKLIEESQQENDNK